MSPRKIIINAVLIDLLLGDPPNRWHLVAWMGQAIHHARQYAPQKGPFSRFAHGMGITLMGSVFVAICARMAVSALSWLPGPVAELLLAYLLKLSFSWRGLDRAAAEVELALRLGELDEARRLLSWHLVSRDTSQLDASQVAAAAIESVAENASDGVVAPLLAYGLFGLPGAMVYRFVNTADAMWGYRDPEREWLGKFPARLDDALNWLPARLTAALIVVAAWLGGTGQRALTVWWRDAHLTASPNAGQPMSAAAGALNVALDKVDHYSLGAGGRAPDHHDLGRARTLLGLALALFVGLMLLLPVRRGHD